MTLLLTLFFWLASADKKWHLRILSSRQRAGFFAASIVRLMIILFLALCFNVPSSVFVMVANNDWMPLCWACRINSLYIGGGLSDRRTTCSDEVYSRIVLSFVSSLYTIYLRVKTHLSHAIWKTTLALVLVLTQIL